MNEEKTKRLPLPAKSLYIIKDEHAKHSKFIVKKAEKEEDDGETGLMLGNI